MDTILDMTQVFLYFVCFCLLPTDIALANVMLLLLFRCQLRHTNHASINISTYIIGGRSWHGI